MPVYWQVRTKHFGTLSEPSPSSSIGYGNDGNIEEKGFAYRTNLVRRDPRLGYSQISWALIRALPRNQSKTSSPWTLAKMTTSQAGASGSIIGIQVGIRHPRTNKPTLAYATIRTDRIEPYTFDNGVWTRRTWDEFFKQSGTITRTAVSATADQIQFGRVYAVSTPVTPKPPVVQPNPPDTTTPTAPTGVGKIVADFLVDVIAKIKTAVTTSIGTITAAIPASFTTAINTLKTTVTSLGTTISSWATEAAKMIKDAVEPTATKVTAGILPALTSIRTTVSTAVTNIGTTISNAVTGMRTAITGAITAIGIRLNSAVETIKTTVISAITSFRSFVGDLLAKQTTTLTNIIASIKTTVTSITTSITTGFTNVATKFSNAITTLIANLKVRLTNIADKVKTSIEEIKDYGFEWGDSLWLYIQRYAFDGISAINSALTVMTASVDTDLFVAFDEALKPLSKPSRGGGLLGGPDSSN